MAATAVTDPATDPGLHTATVHGTVNPDGTDAIAYFEYGPTGSYGRVTDQQGVGSGSSDLPVELTLDPDLDPGSTYHYRVVLADGADPETILATGDDATFTTTGSAVGWGLVIQIHDLETNLLAEISPIVYEATLKRRLNQARTLICTCPAGHPLLTDVADDDYPNLRRGNRKLLAWEDGQMIFHGRIHTTERDGDGTRNTVTITAHNTFMELGYDGDDRAGRPVRGSTNQPTAGDPFGEYDGNFISPLFASSVTDQEGISGPDLIYQILTNSQQTGAETDPTPGEGPLPIDLETGTFDLDVPPAIDLNPAQVMGWPLLIGDFIAQLVDTGVVDVEMRPVDPSEGLDHYIMDAVSAVSSLGEDRSDTVHFDYWTGSKNAAKCRHVDDFATINNKLYDYLGPAKAGGTRFAAGNITPGSDGTTVDPAASRELYGGPDGGQFMQIRIIDTVGDETAARPLYIALWNAEQGYRVEPRDMLFITPAPGSKGLYTAPQNFDVGDQIAINVGSDFGLALAETQRVYGYDKTWGKDRVPRLSELITSADLA